MNYADYELKVPWDTTPKERNEYRKAEAEMIARFNADLAAECGISGNPKEPLVWRLAWSHGHAGGLSEVAYHYREFAELVKP